MNKPYVWIERGCTIEFEGQKFTAGGAMITPEHVVGYIGKVAHPDGARDLTDWHGNVIGLCRITRTWRTPRSYVSSTMSQVYAWVNGAVYTGRSSGEGMLFKGRRTK